MPLANSASSRSPHPDDGCPLRAFHSRSDFYREELRKHWQCLDQQRESYSHKAMTDVEAALGRLMENVDRLCADERGGEVVSRLLRQIDALTRLSASSAGPPAH